MVSPRSAAAAFTPDAVPARPGPTAGSRPGRRAGPPAATARVRRVPTRAGADTGGCRHGRVRTRAGARRTAVADLGPPGRWPDRPRRAAAPAGDQGRGAALRRRVRAQAGRYDAPGPAQASPRDRRAHRDDPGRRVHLGRSGPHRPGRRHRCARTGGGADARAARPQPARATKTSRVTAEAGRAADAGCETAGSVPHGAELRPHACGGPGPRRRRERPCRTRHPRTPGRGISLSGAREPRSLRRSVRPSPAARAMPPPS